MRETTGAEDRPIESSALHKVLVRVVLRLHISRNGLAHGLGTRFVFIILAM